MIGPQHLLLAAEARVLAMPPEWISQAHTDTEVLDAAFGNGQVRTCWAPAPTGGSGPREWLLETSDYLVVVSLSGGRLAGPGDASDGSLDVARYWRMQFLCGCLLKAGIHADWAEMLDADTVLRLASGMSRIRPRAEFFFRLWADRFVPAPERREALVTLAALAGYVNAGDLIREHVSG